MELTPGLCSQRGRSVKCLDLLSAQYCFQPSRTMTFYIILQGLCVVRNKNWWYSYHQWVHFNFSWGTIPFFFFFINTGPFLFGWKLWQISNWAKSSYWSLPHYIAQYTHYMITLTGNSRKYVFYNAKLHASCGGLKHLANWGHFCWNQI